MSETINVKKMLPPWFPLRGRLRIPVAPFLEASLHARVAEHNGEHTSDTPISSRLQI